MNTLNPASAAPSAMRNDGPGRGWYVIAALLFVLAIASLALEIPAVIRNVGSAVYFLAPGSKVIAVDSPRNFTIWHENRTLFEGRTYNTVAALPGGATITVTGPHGEPVAVTSAGGASVTSGSNESHSVASFEAKIPGNYTVTIAGLPDPHVISVSSFSLGGLLGTILGFTLLQSFCTFGALAIVVLIAIARYRKRQPILRASPPPPVSSVRPPMSP